MSSVKHGWWTSLLVLSGLVLCPGCGESSVDPSADTTVDAGDASDTPPPRPYLLGGWAEDLSAGPSTLAGPEELSVDAIGGLERVEMVVVPLDLMGVPWDAFDGPENQPTELPAEWLVSLSEVEQTLADVVVPNEGDAPSVGPQVVLALSPITRDGAALASGTMDDTGKAPQWENCFDPSAESDPTRYAGRYAGYVSYVVNRLAPHAVILGRTMNRVEGECGEAIYREMVGLANAAHERLQLLEEPPTTILEVDVEDLYGYPKRPGRCVAVTHEVCFEERRSLLDVIGTDVLGLHSMPAEALADFETMPRDWLSRIVDAAPTSEAAVTMTSMPAVSLTEQSSSGGPCIGMVESDEVGQRVWLNQVFEIAEERSMPFVAWHPVRDPMPAEVAASCPCAGNDDICYYLDNVNADRAAATRRLVTGGLWGHDESVRLSGAVWTEELAR